MDEYADIPLDRFGRIFFSLVAYDFLWFGYLAGPMYKQFAKIPYRVAALMVYLLVGYALAFGTTGGYLHNLAWCAGVAVLVWGTFNCVVLNIVTEGWTRGMAIGDTLAGIGNCCIAGAVATSMCPVWYPLVTIVGVLGFLAVMKLLQPEPAAPSGITNYKLVVATPPILIAVPITITFVTTSHTAGTKHDATVSHGIHGFTVVLQGTAKEFHGAYPVALLAACNGHDPLVTSVSGKNNAKLGGTVTLEQIMTNDGLREIRATRG
jgi:hypothetical protein